MVDGRETVKRITDPISGKFSEILRMTANISYLLHMGGHCANHLAFVNMCIFYCSHFDRKLRLTR